MHDDLRISLQIPGGFARSRDDRVHFVDQPFGVAAMRALRGAGEQQLQSQPQHVAQDQAQQHLGIAARVPDAQGFARQKGQAAQRDMWDVIRQTRPGGGDVDPLHLQRHQPGNRRGHTRKSAFEVGGNDARVGHGHS